MTDCQLKVLHSQLGATEWRSLLPLEHTNIFLYHSIPTQQNIISDRRRDFKLGGWSRLLVPGSVQVLDLIERVSTVQMIQVYIIDPQASWWALQIDRDSRTLRSSIFTAMRTQQKLFDFIHGPISSRNSTDFAVATLRTGCPAEIVPASLSTQVLFFTPVAILNSRFKSPPPDIN